MPEPLRRAAVCCITAGSNVHARGTARLSAGWEGEGADDLQEAASSVRRAVQSQAMVPALKAIVARRIKDDGWLTLRPPMTGLDENQTTALFAALDEAGF